MVRNNSSWIDLVDSKVEAVKARIADIDSGKIVLSKAAKPSRKSAYTREKNTLLLIAELLAKAPDKIQLSKNSLDTLNSLVSIESKARFSVQVGDSFVKLSRENTTLTWERFIKAVERAGLKEENGVVKA